MSRIDGSQARNAKHGSGWLRRTIRTKLRPIFSQRLSRLAALVVPVLYVTYMRFVWLTSRLRGVGLFDLNAISRAHDGAVALLWHEEVFSVAYGYPYVGIRGTTLASLGESGEVISRMLERCGYVVFRGGSTTGRSRRREGALQEMIDYMQSHHGVIYGLTVDGSRGPAYRMKTGGLVIARECGKPIVLVRTWYKRCIRLPTWDRMAIPLPFNVIHYYSRGPYFVTQADHGQAGLESLRLRLENDLIDLAGKSYDDLRQARPDNLRKRPSPDLDTAAHAMAQ